MMPASCPITVNSQGYELVTHGNALFPAACYQDNLASDPFPWHWHDEMEFLLVVQGTALVHAGSEAYTLDAGDALFVNSGVLHAGAAAGKSACSIRSAVFHPRLIGGSMDSVFWQKYLNPLRSDSTQKGILLRSGEQARKHNLSQEAYHPQSGKDDTGTSPAVSWQEEAVRAFESAWNACCSETPGYEFLVRDALSRIIFLLCRHSPSVHIHPSDKKLRDDERIKNMIQYIQDHSASDITIEDIAHSAAVSVSECLRCFKSTIGTTPIQYVRQYRVQKAAELLSSTPLKVSDIAARCGFQEMSYFARTFRQIRGCSPSEFRNLQREL